MPGKEFKANATPKGNVPVYTANGMQCYLFTLGLLCAGMYYKQVTVERCGKALRCGHLREGGRLPLEH
jgi:hypothetical protein